MNKIRILFIIFVLAHWSFSTLSLFAQNRFDQICVPPQETNRGLATLATYPYYPANATLKSLVIFVKFSDDNFDQSPNTDLWPHTLNMLPSWAPSIISSTVQPNYSNPSISG